MNIDVDYEIYCTCNDSLPTWVKETETDRYIESFSFVWLDCMSNYDMMGKIGKTVLINK